jgi:hypothetical protein
MVYLPEAFPLFDALTRALSQAKERLTLRRFVPLARWSLMQIDGNGVLQTDEVDVLEALPRERMILIRHSPDATPQVVKLSRIVEAIDASTGRKVIIDRWMIHVST